MVRQAVCDVRAARTTTWSRLATAAVWVAAGGLAASLGFARYSDAVAGPQPDFVNCFVLAAEEVAAGRTPYSVAGYYYSPLVALTLAAVVHTGWSVEAWTALRVVCGVVACLVSVVAFTPRGAWLRRGLLTCLAVVTLLYSWPATFDLWAGQPNLLAVLAMAGTVLAHRFRAEATSGLLLGLAAVVKTWPALFLAWFFRRGARGGLRPWLGVATAALLAVLPAWWLGGWQGVSDMVIGPLHGADQPALAANSVWGVGRMMFSPSSVGAPLLISPLLQWLTTSALVLLVVGMGTLTLWRPGDDLISLYNVAFVTILLLPVSHFYYLVYPLPALWWWASRCTQDPRSRTAWIVTAVLVAWWLVAFRIAPVGDGFATTTWQSLTRIFVATLAAAFASVVGAARLASKGQPQEA